jgi:hypothetical protein
MTKLVRIKPRRARERRIDFVKRRDVIFFGFIFVMLDCCDERAAG